MNRDARIIVSHLNRLNLNDIENDKDARRKLKKNRPNIYRQYRQFCKILKKSQSGGFFWDTCEETYPLYDRSQIPNLGKTLEKFIPKQWINVAAGSGQTVSTLMQSTEGILGTLGDIFDVFDETQGSVGVRVAKSAAHVITSAIATVATIPAGGVGGNAANVPSLIAKAVSIIKKIMGVIQKLYQRVKPIISKGIDVMRKIDVRGKLDMAHSILAQANEKIEFIQDFVDAKLQLQFMYDVFSVTFTGGPAQCKCWVDYIMKVYFGPDVDKKQVTSMYCLLTEIYSEINKVLISLLGSVIDTLIPGTMGLGGVLLQFAEKYSYVVYREALNFLGEMYDSIDSDFTEILENPEKLRDFVYEQYDTYVTDNVGFFGEIILDKVGDLASYITSIDKEMVDKGIDTVGHAIHKGMALIFTFLNLFVSIGELQAGDSEIEIADDVRQTCGEDVIVQPDDQAPVQE